jgi:hypothetical protein
MSTRPDTTRPNTMQPLSPALPLSPAAHTLPSPALPLSPAALPLSPAAHTLLSPAAQRHAPAARAASIAL